MVHGEGRAGLAAHEGSRATAKRHNGTLAASISPLSATFLHLLAGCPDGAEGAHVAAVLTDGEEAPRWNSPMEECRNSLLIQWLKFFFFSFVSCQNVSSRDVLLVFHCVFFLVWSSIYSRSSSSGVLVSWLGNLAGALVKDEMRC
ncbi:hypothetical protein PVAP13_9NG221373 [Panicum virgatum]|uniref:Uncharacterized protein n=1 Tax=Panicum virgatum TaxID=38727 RepID=A0A8T0MPI4_PANVG|nr:hypothetical protein PVAP13_9NG221373 [Panicum virgatum]